MKIKIKNKFDEMKPRKGTVQVGESMTDQSQAADADIYECLKKYGISTLVNKTQATEFLYVDNTNRNMTLDEAVRQRKELEEYFKQQPARVRKTFGDNVDIFIEKYKNKEFDEFLTTGVLSQEMVTKLTEEEKTNEEMAKDTTGPESIRPDISQGAGTTLGGDNGGV